MGVDHFTEIFLTDYKQGVVFRFLVEFQVEQLDNEWMCLPPYYLTL